MFTRRMPLLVLDASLGLLVDSSFITPSTPFLDQRFDAANVDSTGGGTQTDTAGGLQPVGSSALYPPGTQPDVTDSWVDIGPPLGYDTRGNIIQPTSTPVLDEPGGSGTTSPSGRWFNLFGSPPAGEGAAVPPQTIKPFGYRDIWKTYDSTPVEVIGNLPDWLFRDGVFYKQAGGAFDIPGTNPPTSGSSVSATTSSGSASSGTDNSGPDSKQFLDGLAHVAAWRFVKASASPPSARGRAGKSRNLVLFSNGFPDTEAFEKWHKSGGRNRQFAGTAGGSAKYLFNPNVNFQRCDKDLIAPCLIEAPIKTRMVPMDPHSLLTETATRDMNALIQNARDCTDCSGPGHLSFMSTTPATSGEASSYYEELRAVQDRLPPFRSRRCPWRRRASEGDDGGRGLFSLPSTPPVVPSPRGGGYTGAPATASSSFLVGGDKSGRSPSPMSVDDDFGDAGGSPGSSTTAAGGAASSSTGSAPISPVGTAPGNAPPRGSTSNGSAGFISSGPSKYANDLVFLASHQLEMGNRQNYHCGFYLTPGKDCKMGYRVYKLCHDPEATAPGAGRSASSPSSSTSATGTAGESSQRCCDVLADDVLATCDFPTLFQDKVPAEHCPCMMHTTIETQKYMILAETSLRWRPGKTLQNKILGQLPLIGKRWRVPFFNQFEYKEELPIAFRVYEKKPRANTVRFVCRIEAEKSGHLFHVANAYDEEADAECNRIVVDSDFLNQWEFGGGDVTERGMVRWCLEFPKGGVVPTSGGGGGEAGQPCEDSDYTHGRGRSDAEGGGSFLTALPYVENAEPTDREIAAASSATSDEPANVSSPAALATGRLPTTTATKRLLLDQSPGFPVANPAFLRQKSRFFYAVTNTDFTSLSKVDACTGETTIWKLKGDSATHRWQVSEPQFVPRIGEPHHDSTFPTFFSTYGAIPLSADVRRTCLEEEELDGVLMVAANDQTEEKSYLMVLDPKTMEEIARITAPIDVNYGLHSQFVGPEKPDVLPLKF